MNFINRLLGLTLALLVCGVALLALLVGAGVVVPPPGVFADMVAGVGGASVLSEVGPVLVAILALLVGIGLLYLELRPRRRTDHLVEATELGELTLSRRTLRDFIVYVGLQVPDVRSMTVQVTEAPDGMHVVCRVDANVRAVLSELGESIRQAVRERVREQLGLEIARIDTVVRMSTTRAQRPVVK
ncbi:MAG: alkaline shock response membrane anchor protein AmaP [Myxococcota bacterium]